MASTTARYLPPPLEPLPDRLPPVLRTKRGQNRTPAGAAVVVLADVVEEADMVQSQCGQLVREAKL